MYLIKRVGNWRGFRKLAGVQVRFGRPSWDGSQSLLFIMITLNHVDSPNSLPSKHVGTEGSVSNRSDQCSPPRPLDALWVGANIGS